MMRNQPTRPLSDNRGCIRCIRVFVWAWYWPWLQRYAPSL